MPLAVLAENLPLDHGIPPWITLAFIALWVGAVVLAVALWRRRRAMRLERLRATTSGRRRASPAQPPDDRQLGPGTDVEAW